MFNCRLKLVKPQIEAKTDKPINPVRQQSKANINKTLAKS